MTYAQELGTFTIIVAVALFIWWAVSAARQAKRAKRARSMAAHPAGRARVLPVQESRHLDTAGYDWVNGPL
jgi:cell division protein FtsW (lipid II flippase)